MKYITIPVRILVEDDEDTEELVRHIKPGIDRGINWLNGIKGITFSYGSVQVEAAE